MFLSDAGGGISSAKVVLTMSVKFIRRTVLWLSLSLGCVLSGYAIWKVLWPIGQAFCQLFVTLYHRESLPNPVVVKDGVYWFPLGGRVFAVPQSYVVSYGRNATDGSLNSFSLHALLPDFVGHSPETAKRFKVTRGEKIEILVHTARHDFTQIESEQLDYNGYLSDVDSLKRLRGQDPVVVSEDPYIVKLSPLLGDDAFYLIEDQRVKKEIKCMIKEEDYQRPSCDNISIYYRGSIRLYVIYSRAYEKDWIAINDRLISWLESFERPVTDFPQPTASTPLSGTRNPDEDVRVAVVKRLKENQESTAG